MASIYEADFTLHPAKDSGKRQQRLKPVIMLPFTYCDFKLDISALIDSGADESVSFKEIGESLGIKFFGKPTKSVSGITGEENAWEVPIFVTIGDEIIQIKVSWLDRKFEPDADYMIALGREKVFDIFDVSFTKNKKVIFSK